jgi:hypothetical protein
MAEGEKHEAGGGRQEADSRKQTHYCLLTTVSSLLATLCRSATMSSTHYCLLATRYSVPPRDHIFYSLLSTRYSLLCTAPRRYLLLTTVIHTVALARCSEPPNKKRKPFETVSIPKLTATTPRFHGRLWLTAANLHTQLFVSSLSKAVTREGQSCDSQF